MGMAMPTKSSTIPRTGRGVALRSCSPPDSTAEAPRGSQDHVGLYPGDKAFGTQWFSAGTVTQVTARRLSYMVDTFGGQKWQRGLVLAERPASRSRCARVRRVSE